MKTLGKYNLVEPLGTGGMGVVYRAFDTVLERDVAIKTIFTGAELDPEIKERFYREARAYARLQHPNIVTVYDLGEEEGVTYIVMELLLGADLRRIISERRPLKLETKIELLAQLLEGLAYAHRHDIVHRDVKPGNVFVHRGDCAKILDLGIARVPFSRLTRTGSALGTPDYMAPEQIAAQICDARSDLFSAAIVAFEFLAYTHPFAGPHVARRIAGEPPAPLRVSDASISAAVEQVIAKGLEKRAEARFQSGDEFAAALRAARDGAPRVAPVRPASPFELPGGPARPRPAPQRQPPVVRAAPVPAARPLETAAPEPVPADYEPGSAAPPEWTAKQEDRSQEPGVRINTRPNDGWRAETSGVLFSTPGPASALVGPSSSPPWPAASPLEPIALLPEAAAGAPPSIAATPEPYIYTPRSVTPLPEPAAWEAAPAVPEPEAPMLAAEERNPAPEEIPETVRHPEPVAAAPPKEPARRPSFRSASLNPMQKRILGWAAAAVLLLTAGIGSHIRPRAAAVLPSVASAEVNSSEGLILNSPERKAKVLVRVGQGERVNVLQLPALRQQEWVDVQYLSGGKARPAGFLTMASLGNWSSENPDAAFYLLVLFSPGPSASEAEIHEQLEKLAAFTSRFGATPRGPEANFEIGRLNLVLARMSRRAGEPAASRDAYLDAATVRLAMAAASLDLAPKLAQARRELEELQGPSSLQP